MKALIAGLVLALVASGAMADERVTEADVAGHGDMAYRAKSSTLYLSATGDLNGDGIDDEAVFVKRSGKVKVSVTFGTKERQPIVVVTMLPMRAFDLKTDMPRMGVDIVEHELVVGTCDKPACEPVAVSKYGVSVFTFESGALLYTWNGKRFVETTLAD
ncbi:hypothetical protein PQU92_02860 [Asticcacaulis sp. BYS171W]|uniref:Uncharacterized protein n=1 Tax=Asticcacaulis aquaticus TaxID=2984212 RepID=A0ABT5HQ71_9CAUL|nr:hypothetical protein [Asticcacaulis aquaticus]MDC7682199.1 hypothetical protein [Asticcacaulis aquaticus]